MVERRPRQDGRRADCRADGGDKKRERALSAGAAAGGCASAQAAAGAGQPDARRQRAGRKSGRSRGGAQGDGTPGPVGEGGGRRWRLVR
eukprot:5951337-Prymnesium_polylepis.1